MSSKPKERATETDRHRNPTTPVPAIRPHPLHSLLPTPQESAERFGPDRAYELLALASLGLHRLEFAERRASTVVLPEQAPIAR